MSVPTEPPDDHTPLTPADPALDDAARILGISRRLTYRLIERGELKTYVLGRRRVDQVFRAKCLAAVIEAFKTIRFRQATLAQIDEANEIVGEYLTLGFILTLRQLFYQFVSRQAVANALAEYKGLGRTVTDARRAGRIDWGAIEDRTRNVRRLPTWDDPSEIVSACASQYRESLWSRQPYRPEVWIEKDALIGVIEGVSNEFRVPYFSCRGNVSESEMYAAGKRFAAQLEQGQVPVVLHLVDHDPNGLDMTRDIRERLKMFARQEIEVRRLALNLDQTAGLPPNFAKEKDSRYAAYVRRFGRDCWELDALSPNVISGLVRAELEA